MSMTPALLSASLLFAALGTAGLLGAAVGLRRPWQAARRQARDEGLCEQERDFAVSALSAEVAHELAAARLFLQDLVAHAPLEQTDREIGREEVLRLEKLLARLRRSRRAEEARVEQPLLPVVQRALARVPALRHKRLRVTVELPPGTEVRAGPRGLEMLLVCLLRRAAQTAPASGSLAVRVQQGAPGLLLDVEEAGTEPGEALHAQAFHPLDLLGCGGPGLDLLVAMGVARGQGWRLGWLREDGRTVFRLALPPSDSLLLPARRAA
jgi:hypothetical protein